MVVFAVSICTKTGKALVSRQFVEITRSRIEGLLAAFPKLIGTGGKQHTFIETENVRYLYQPMEELYMVVLTNKASNILEDLETLHILTKLIPEYCRNVNEKIVCEKSFDLIFAFDEVIALGYKEKVNLGQIKTFTEMDSHDERVAEIVERNKEREAKEAAKRRLKEIERERRERERMGLPSTSGIGSQSKYGNPGVYSQPHIEQRRETPTQERNPGSQKAPAVQGLQLKKTESKTNSYLKSLKNEGDLVDLDGSPTIRAVKSDLTASPHEEIHIQILEKLLVKTDRDGSLHKMEARGELMLTLAREDQSQVFLQLDKIDTKNVQIKTHPNIDRARFLKEQVLCLKDSRKTYPVNTPTPLLKWRYQTQDDSQLPLTLTCWPSTSRDGVTIVNLEYELGGDREFELSDVLIRIPVVGKEQPKVNHIEGGTYDFDSKNSLLEWSIPTIDQSNASGSMEFSLTLWNKSNNATSFLFPIHISFNSDRTYFNTKVLSALASEQGNPVKYSQKKNLSVESFTIEESSGSF